MVIVDLGEAMANATASMAGLSQGLKLESSLVGSNVVSSSSSSAAVVVKCGPVQVRAHSEEAQNRRAFLSLAAASLAATALAGNARALEDIKLAPPPPPFGGLRKSPPLRVEFWGALLRFIATHTR